MSYDGYEQYICGNGHYWTKDAISEMYGDGTGNICFKCQEPAVWHNSVNLTNGSYDEVGNQIDGYIEPEVDKIDKCEHCGSTLNITYKVPDKLT